MKSVKLIGLAVLLLLFITVAFATESRMNSMGGVYGFLRDDTDVMRYPGTIHAYNRIVFAEMRSWNDKSNWTVGGNVPFYDNVFGFRFNVPTEFQLLDIDFDDEPYRQWNDITLDHKINFIFGFMENFGAGFGMAMDRAKYTYPNNEELDINMMLLEVLGGYSNDLFDLGLSIQLPTGSMENESTRDEGDIGGMILNLNGRYFIMEESKFSLMAIADMKMRSLSTEYKEFYENTLDSTEKVDLSSLNFSVGVGINYYINENNLLVLALRPFGLMKDTSEDEYLPAEGNKIVNKVEESATILPEYRVGFESKINSWLTGRVGAYQQYHFKSYEENRTVGSTTTLIDKYSYYESNFNVSLGFAANFRNFTLDGVLSDALLFDGPNFIGGRNPGIATQLSLKYKF